jgi:hypothetical protein
MRNIEAVQVSVLIGQGVSDGLTFLDCTAGEQTCSFETLLSAAFYRKNAGVVQGSGIASGQFGISARSGDRNLQQAPNSILISIWLNHQRNIILANSVLMEPVLVVV